MKRNSAFWFLLCLCTVCSVRPAHFPLPNLVSVLRREKCIIHVEWGVNPHYPSAAVLGCGGLWLVSGALPPFNPMGIREEPYNSQLPVSVLAGLYLMLAPQKTQT